MNETKKENFETKDRIIFHDYCVLNWTSSKLDIYDCVCIHGCCNNTSYASVYTKKFLVPIIISILINYNIV